METSLRKMGNSTGIIVPKAMLDELGLSSGSKVDLRVVDGKFVGEPIKRKVREGWEEDAREIAALGMTAEEREWVEFEDPIDGDWTW